MSGLQPSYGGTTASVLVARLLGAAQGALWFVLLIHGGTGLLFGPMAWIATVVGGRIPAVAVILLVAPVAWLSNSWAPILFDGARLGDWAVFAALVVPALVSTAIFLRTLVVSLSRRPDLRT